MLYYRGQKKNPGSNTKIFVLIDTRWESLEDWDIKAEDGMGVLEQKRKPDTGEKIWFILLVRYLDSVYIQNTQHRRDN